MPSKVAFVRSIVCSIIVLLLRMRLINGNYCTSLKLARIAGWLLILTVLLLVPRKDVSQQELDLDCQTVVKLSLG